MRQRYNSGLNLNLDNFCNSSHLLSGVVVQPAETRYMMHHKFAVIDQEILITGSFNWTAQATMGNWDNAIITSTSDLVAPFVTEFERMWHLFSNPQDPQDLEAAQKKLKKYPFLKNSAWDGIIIGHQTPQVCH
jgi:phosphatidylserine/phosphatidylglycerophosphate/cardiolipin synthase-like enzyme